MHIPATLCLIPGLLCDDTAWRDQIAQLGDVAIISVPRSRHVGSIGGMAEFILDSIAGSFAVAGHSMGGRVALEIMRRAPQRVSGLALLDTGYEPLAAGEAGAREVARRKALLMLAQTRGMRAMGWQWLQGMVHPHRMNDERLINSILQMIELSSPELFESQLYALINRPDATDLLATIRCPTLVLCGENDTWSPLSRHQHMVDTIPHSWLVSVGDCGHMSTMERPDEVSSALRAWLRRLNDPGG